MSNSMLPSLPQSFRREFLGESTPPSLPSTAAQADKALETLREQLLRAIAANQTRAIRVIVRQFVFTGVAIEDALSTEQLSAAFLSGDNGDAARAFAEQLETVGTRQWPMSELSTGTLLQNAAGAGLTSLVDALLELKCSEAILRRSGWDALRAAATAGHNRVLEVLLVACEGLVPVSWGNYSIVRAAFRANHASCVETLLTHLVSPTTRAPTELLDVCATLVLENVKSTTGSMDMLLSLMIPGVLTLYTSQKFDVLTVVCKYSKTGKLVAITESLYDSIGIMTSANSRALLNVPAVEVLRRGIDGAILWLIADDGILVERKRAFLAMLLSSLKLHVHTTAHVQLGSLPALISSVAAACDRTLWEKALLLLKAAPHHDAVALSESQLHVAAARSYHPAMLVPMVRLSAASSPLHAQLDSSPFLEKLAALVPSDYTDWPFPGAHLIAASFSGNTREVRKLLDTRNSEALHARDDLAFRTACARGHTEVVKMFLYETKFGRVEPAEYQSGALLAACEGGHVAVVQQLLEACGVLPQDPEQPHTGHKTIELTANSCLPYRVACWAGKADVVRLLDEAYALSACSHQGSMTATLAATHSVQASARRFEPLILAAATGSVSVIEYLLTPTAQGGAPPIDLRKLTTATSTQSVSLMAEAIAVATQRGHAAAISALLQTAKGVLTQRELLQAIHVAIQHDQPDSLQVLLEHAAADDEWAEHQFGGLLQVAAEHGSLSVIASLTEQTPPRHNLQQLQSAFIAAALGGDPTTMVALLQSATPSEAGAMACCLPAAAAAIKSGRPHALRIMLVLFALNPLLRSWCAGDGMLLALGQGDGTMAQVLFEFELFFKQLAMLRHAAPRLRRHSSGSGTEAEAAADHESPTAASFKIAERFAPKNIAGLSVPVEHVPLLERLPLELQAPLERVLWSALTAEPSVSVAAEHSKSLRSGHGPSVDHNSHPLLEELDLNQGVPYEHTADSEIDTDLDRSGSEHSVESPHKPSPTALSPSPARGGAAGEGGGAWVPASQLGYVFRESPQLRNMLKLASKSDPDAAAKLASAARAFVGKGGWADCAPGRRVLLYPVMVAACCAPKQSMGSFFIELFRPAYLQDDGTTAVPHGEWPEHLRGLTEAYTASAVAAAAAGNSIQLQQVLEELVWLGVPEQSIKLAVITSLCSALNAGNWYLLRELLFASQSQVEMATETQQYVHWGAYVLMGAKLVGSASWGGAADRLPAHLKLRTSVDRLFEAKPLRIMPDAIPMWVQQLAHESMDRWAGLKRGEARGLDPQADSNPSQERRGPWRPSGLRRTREQAYSTLSNCIPGAVHSPDTWKNKEEATPLKPSALIKDSFEPGDIARVVLVSKHAYLERNELATTDWGNEAFGFSPVAAHRRGRVLAEQARIKAQQDEEKRIAAEKRKKELEEQAAALLESGGEDIGKIFGRDWVQVQHCLELIPPLHRVEETESIKQILLQYYQPLRDLFRFYSNLLDDPDDKSPGYSMSCNEFVNLVLDAGITLGSMMSQQLFVYAVSGSKTNRRSPTMGMNRVAMLEAILIAAADVGQSRAQELGVTGAALKLDASAVQYILDMHIMPVADQTTSSAGVRAQLGSSEVVPVIIRGTPAMKALFSTFADCEEDEDGDEDDADTGAGGEDDPIDSLAMTEGAYMSMLAAIGILEAEKDEVEQEGNKALARKAAAPQIGQGAGSDVLTRAEASLAFKLAQSEDEGAATDDMPVEGLEELDFQECIEAFAHVALGKWEDPDVNLGSKMAWLIDMMEEWLDINGVTYNKDAALMEV